MQHQPFWVFWIIEHIVIIVKQLIGWIVKQFNKLFYNWETLHGDLLAGKGSSLITLSVIVAWSLILSILGLSISFSLIWDGG